jgi:hypothetical protein
MPEKSVRRGGRFSVFSFQFSVFSFQFSVFGFQWAVGSGQFSHWGGGAVCSMSTATRGKNDFEYFEYCFFFDVVISSQRHF